MAQHHISICNKKCINIDIAQTQSAAWMLPNIFFERGQSFPWKMFPICDPCQSRELDIMKQCRTVIILQNVLNQDY